MDTNAKCQRCHTGTPAWSNVATERCATCHTIGGKYNGVTDPLIGALNNWENRGSSASAAQSLIYDTAGNLRSGKERWCAGCHDQPYEMRTKVIDDCEGSLHEWHPLYDAHDPTSAEGIMDKCMHLSIEWDKDTAQDRGRMQRAFDPALDLSGTDAFNFYLKLYHPNGMLRIKKVIVKLRKPGDTVCESSVLTSDLDLTNDERNLVSLPTESFDDSTWTLVTQVIVILVEKNPGKGYTIHAYLDEIGCGIENAPVTGPDVTADNETSGYYVTGHRMYCTRCHDPAGAHIDGNKLPALKYIKRTDNPTNFPLLVLAKSAQDSFLSRY
jgi:hypothetical protein